MFPVLLRLQQKFLRTLVWCEVFERVKIHSAIRKSISCGQQEVLHFKFCSKCCRGANKVAYKLHQYILGIFNRTWHKLNVGAASSSVIKCGINTTSIHAS